MPSAYSVPIASDVLPDPDTPTTATVRHSGTSTSRSRSLLCRAPRTPMTVGRVSGTGRSAAVIEPGVPDHGWLTQAGEATASRRSARRPGPRRRWRPAGSRPAGRSRSAIAAAMSRRAGESSKSMQRPGAVALEPVADVEVLLEVVAAAGSTGTAAGSRSAPSPWSARPARRRGRRRPGGGTGRARTGGPRARRARAAMAGSIRGPATDDHAQARAPAACASGKAAITRRSRWPPDPGAADGDDADLLVGPVAELGSQRVAVGELGGVEAGDVAGEVVVLLGPVADRRQARRRSCRARCRRARRRRSPGRAARG